MGNLFNERKEKSTKGELLSVTLSNGVTKFSDLNKKDNSNIKSGNYKVVKKNDIPYNSMRMWQGASGVSSYDGIVSPAYTVLVPNRNSNSNFYAVLFKKKSILNLFTRFSQGLTSDTWNLKYPILKDIIVPFTNLEEQKRIFKIFNVINNLLALYERKLKLLSKTKKYFLQKLFVNGMQKHPVIRFREFNDDWKEKKLTQLFKISNETNLDNKLCFSKQDVLSVSDKFGVVNQIKLQGRSFAGNNISKYKVVRNNQIVYTKSPLKDKPYGIIKIVSNIKGIVSPLYIVNNVIGNNAWFIYYYFDLKSRTNNYLKPLVRLGAKHTMNITDKEWLSGKIFISEVIQEQEKIANLLNMIDKLIRLNEQQLSNLEELKECLLQNMFC